MSHRGGGLRNKLEKNAVDMRDARTFVYLHIMDMIFMDRSVSPIHADTSDKEKHVYGEKNTAGSDVKRCQKANISLQAAYIE